MLNSLNFIFSHFCADIPTDYTQFNRLSKGKTRKRLKAQAHP
jgi:hypothetical protein